ncbi:hypothetical protein Agub_g15862, partial [Astrephomene gubernaculifera]
MVDSLEQLQRREQELAELRNRTLQSLEQQLATREHELVALTQQFEALKADFTYNLDLLRQRDEELASYDEAAVQHQAHEAALRGRVAELEALAGSLQSDLAAARAASEQQQFLLSAQRSELAALREEERLGRAEAALRQREQAEAARRGMQRELEEVREAAERQRVALQAAHQQQLQRAEEELAEAKQAASASARLAEQRQRELQEAAERE